MDDFDYVREAGRLCQELARRLPEKHTPSPHQTFRTASGAEITAKLPSKLLASVVSLVWRANDLAELSHELFERKRVVPGIILTRSVMECAALVYLIHRKTTQAVDAQALGALDAFLISCIAGSRTMETDPQAPSVLTAIDHLEKEPGAEGFRGFYDSFSEFAHPNALGAFYAYARYENEDRSLSFGHNQGLTRSGDVAFGLVFALEILIEFYDRTLELLPDVSRIAEREYHPGA